MKCPTGNLWLNTLAFILLGAMCPLASAEKPSAVQLTQREWQATGGHSWNTIGGAQLTGTISEGGVPSKFRKTLDLHTGKSRTVMESGEVEGFDGVKWFAKNGVLNFADLPSVVQDDSAQAFLDRFGWRKDAGQLVSGGDAGKSAGIVRFTPDGASPVLLSFDRKGGLVTQAVIETDFGPLTTTYSDWRWIGKVRFPFRYIQKDNTGETTVIEIQHVELKPNLSDTDLARPEVTPHGRLVDGKESIVPFTYVGAKKSHILVPAKIAGIDANLIFDTGAANYFSPSSAERFGLKVYGGVNLSGPGESSTSGGFATVSKMSLGSAELTDEIVMVGPSPFGQGPDLPAGLAGFEFLSEFQTTLDYPAQTITFAPFDKTPPAEGIRVPFYSDGHSIYIDAEVDDHKGLFRLDTGDGGAVTLFPNFAKAHGLYQNSEAETDKSSAGVGGSVAAHRIQIDRFKLAGVLFRKLPGRLSENSAGAFSSHSLAGNLGGGILRCFRITFDYRARLLTLRFSGTDSQQCRQSNAD